jgi:hypothetical protein
MRVQSLLVLLLLACLGNAASAQSFDDDPKVRTARPGAVSFGPRVGISISSHSTEEDDGGGVNVRYKSGVLVGAVANIGLSEVFSIQPELLYIQKGVSVHLDVNETYPGGTYSIEGENELRSNYLELPVLGKATFNAGNIQYYFTAGPTLGYWLSGKEILDYTERYVEATGTINHTADTEMNVEFDAGEKRLEAGASIGMGLGFSIGTGTLSVDARYGMGLTSLYDEDEGRQKTKNRVIGVSFAYLFGK